MKKILFLATITIGLFAACSENKVVLNETHEFADAKWQRFEPESFKFDISDTAACYDIYFRFRIDTATFRPEMLPFICTLIENEDYKRQLTTEIAIRDKRGIWLGNPVGRYYEFDRKVREYFFFNAKGPHELLVKNGSQYFETEGILTFGVKIVKVNMDLKIE